jgi:hypothetical protein
VCRVPSHSPLFLFITFLSLGDGTAPDRLQIVALAIGMAPYHLQVGTLTTSARTGTTAEAPGPILAIGAAPYHLQVGTLATSARTGTTAEAP